MRCVPASHADRIPTARGAVSRRSTPARRVLHLADMKKLFALVWLVVASSGCVIRGGEEPEPPGRPQDVCGNWRQLIERTRNPAERADLLRRAPPECRRRLADL